VLAVAGRTAAARDDFCVALRTILYRGEACRLPRRCPGLRVVSGEAWVAFDGRDTVIGAGEVLLLEGKRGFAVVSPVGREALVLEVLARLRHRRWLHPLSGRGGPVVVGGCA
jgi:hypothetical protein